MHIVGIDPGLAGAVAVLDTHGTLEALADTPTLVLKVQRGMRQVYNVPSMAALLRPYAGQQCQVCEVARHAALSWCGPAVKETSRQSREPLARLLWATGMERD